MREATRVILGASALLSNGAMLAPAGTAMIAALAKMQRIPVIVACESYKFTEKFQLDSIVNNELGAASEVAVVKASGDDGAAESEPVPQLSIGYRGAAEKLGADGSEGSLPFQVVNLRYDLTPIGNIAVIATETGLIRKYRRTHIYRCLHIISFVPFRRFNIDLSFYGFSSI
jgi:translation initiation factor eIF-2B subunit delta